MLPSVEHALQWLAVVEVAIAIVELVARRSLRRILAALFLTIAVLFCFDRLDRAAGGERLFQSGVKLEKAGEHGAAFEKWKELEKQDPTHPGLHLNMAATARALGELDQAETFATEAIEELIENNGRQGPIRIGNAYYTRAAIRFAHGKFDEALADLRKAVDDGFPYQVSVQSDVDLRAMAGDSRFQPYIRSILRNGNGVQDEQL